MQPKDPLALKVNEACATAGIGRTSLYEAIKTGQLAARKRGKSTLVLTSDLRRWLESLPTLNGKATGADPAKREKA